MILNFKRIERAQFNTKSNIIRLEMIFKKFQIKNTNILVIVGELIENGSYLVEKSETTSFNGNFSTSLISQLFSIEIQMAQN